MKNDITLDDATCELLDLYACGALDADEEKKAQEIIATSSEARAYVEESQSVFAQFEDNSQHSPELLARIKDSIRESESQSEESTNVVPLSSRSKKPMLMSFLGGAVAASIVAFLVVSLAWPTTETQESATFSLEEQIEKFGSAEGVQNVSLVGADNEQSATLMLNPRGDVMVDARGIDALDDDHTYQLWAVVETATGQAVISAGVLGSSPDVMMTHVEGKIVAFALTKEVSGGVEKSQQEAAFSAELA
jgi:anti-sigma-K factor RskA